MTSPRFASIGIGALAALGIVATAGLATAIRAAETYPADRDSPGDAMIQAYLTGEAARIDGQFLAGIQSADDWRTARPRLMQEYLTMLGLWPLPERSPLQAVVTGRLERDDYTVDKLHFQSRPGLYVTGNLYRPRRAVEGERLPAVLYVCGHAHMGRDGNKVWYQGNPIWLARHGYLCLAIDTLQLGEVAGIHHGTYREGRWWWHSRGYTSAGVECWNGIRAIDYLVSRGDVDPRRIAVTGISGGGAATLWIAAADERVAVAAPISGMADLQSYVGDRVINGHCDCMFLHNQFAWPWTTIAALIAPRPLLFVNSDQDSIFPMDANERVTNRLERIYSLFGASDQVDALVSIGGHAYRQDIRQGVYRFLNTRLLNDPRPIADSEADLVGESKPTSSYPIPPRELRVFPTDDDLPRDALNHRIDELFVPLAAVEPPKPNDFSSWQAGLLQSLRELPLRGLSGDIPPARPVAAAEATTELYETEPGIRIAVHRVGPAPARPQRCLLWVGPPPADAGGLIRADDLVYWCEPRGTGQTNWTTKNPPNFVERAHLLIGQTADTGRIRDVVAAAKLLKSRHPIALCVAGSEASAVLAAYAMLLTPEIDRLIALSPPPTHQSASAPQLLSVLRVCDIPEVLGLLAPRAVELHAADARLSERVQAIYRAAGATERLQIQPVR